MKRMALAFVLAFSAAAQAATVERLFARQMWPWQTHFEVSYVLRTSPAEAVDVSLKVSAGGDEYAIPASELLGETAGLTAGEYKLVWDSTVSSVPTAAWLKTHAGELTFSVVTAPSASVAEYLIIDLSGGASAASWPSERVIGKPYGGWTDEYKTTKLVLRRIYAGGSGNVFSSTAGVTFKFGCDSGADQEYKCSLDFDAVDATLTNDYWIGVFELTQKQYQLITGTSVSSAFKTGDTCPQTQISYYTHMRGTTTGYLWPSSSDVDADSLMGILRAKVALPAEIPSAWKFDLPTEAQWEYACRAGTTGPWNNGGTYDVYIYDEAKNLEGDHNLDLIGWNPANCTTKGMPVGGKLANAWGLYDMHGNASEYCLDYNPSSITTSGRVGFEPLGYKPSASNLKTTAARVIKGGGYSPYWTSITDQKYWKGHRSCGHVQTYNGTANEYHTCRITLRNSAVNAGH